jgi:hypothetical protein
MRFRSVPFQMFGHWATRVQWEPNMRSQRSGELRGAVRGATRGRGRFTGPAPSLNVEASPGQERRQVEGLPDGEHVALEDKGESQHGRIEAVEQRVIQGKRAGAPVHRVGDQLEEVATLCRRQELALGPAKVVACEEREG